MNEAQLAINTARSRVIAAAAGRIGTPDASSFWNVCGREPFSRKRAWCGIFALWALREAGLAHFDWDFGRGFLYRLPVTETPQPGDIGYIEHPYQHHLIVERIDGDRVFSIDGNSPRVQRRERPLAAITAFYSIEPLILLAHALEAYPEPEPPKAA